MEVTALGLFQQRSLAHVCYDKGCWLGFALVEVPGLGLVLQRSLAWAYFLSDHSLITTLAGVADLVLLIQACCGRGPCLGHIPTEVFGLSLLPWQLLPLICTCEGCWLTLALAEVTDSSLLL